LEVLDGATRLRIAARLGIPFAKIPWDKVRGLSPEQRRQRAVALNLHRRHLSPSQRVELAARLLTASPTRSNRDIAAEAGVDPKTVAARRREHESTGEIPQLEETCGRDGRVRPVRRPQSATPAAPGPVPEHARPEGP